MRVHGSIVDTPSHYPCEDSPTFVPDGDWDKSDLHIEEGGVFSSRNSMKRSYASPSFVRDHVSLSTTKTSRECGQICERIRMPTSTNVETCVTRRVAKSDQDMVGSSTVCQKINPVESPLWLLATMCDGPISWEMRPYSSSDKPVATLPDGAIMYRSKLFVHDVELGYYYIPTKPRHSCFRLSEIEAFLDVNMDEKNTISLQFGHVLDRFVYVSTLMECIKEQDLKKNIRIQRICSLLTFCFDWDIVIRELYWIRQRT